MFFNFLSRVDYLKSINGVKVTRSSKRKKTITLRIRNGFPELLCPIRTDEKFISLFLKEKEEWIRRKIKKQKETILNGKNFKEDSVMYMGNLLKVKIVTERNDIFLKDKVIEIPLDSNSKNSQKKKIREWLKNKAIKYLSKRINFLSHSSGISYEKLIIKEYRRRWGCCFDQKDIFLNWKLIMLPSQIIDYVIIHELCHIVHPNHSKSFWNLVEIKDPEFKKNKEWLKLYGNPFIEF